jgi:hypothetical protein
MGRRRKESRGRSESKRRELRVKPSVRRGVAASARTRPGTEARRRFERFARKWRRETAVASSTVEMAMHPAYQAIIGMGERAVPLILQSLARRLDHWFWALEAITQENPVPRRWRGDIEKMAEAWLKWGRARGLIASNVKAAAA